MRRCTFLIVVGTLLPDWQPVSAQSDALPTHPHYPISAGVPQKRVHRREQAHHTRHHSHDHGGAPCGTEPEFDLPAYSFSLHERKLESQSRLLQGVVVFPVCVHIVRPVNDTDVDPISREAIQNVLDEVNVDFSSSSCCEPSQSWCNGECSVDTGFQFAFAEVDETGELQGTTTNDVSSSLACITETVNDDWYESRIGSDDYVTMKMSLRKGGANTLNIYVAAIRSSFGTRLGGRATFPQEYSSRPELDGIDIIQPNSVSSLAITHHLSEVSPPIQTIVSHEIGHWLGLLHTFQGGGELPSSSCTANRGDQVNDTPPEKTASTRCDVSRNTCLSDNRTDPVHNFMDYSETGAEKCQYEFTAGQKDRMMTSALAYRLNISARDDVEYSEEDGSVPIPGGLGVGGVQSYRIVTDEASNVECVTQSVDLLMRKTLKPDLVTGDFDCFSSGRNTLQYCSVTLQQQGIAWVTIRSRGIEESSALNCTTTPLPPVTPLEGNTTVNAEVAVEEFSVYQLAVPASADELIVTCKKSDSIGVQILVRGGDQSLLLDGPRPLSVFDCDIAPLLTSGNCTVPIPQGTGDIFVATIGTFRRIANVSFSCSIEQAKISIAETLLLDGIPSEPISIDDRELAPFSIDIPSNASGVECVAATTSGSGVFTLNWGVSASTSQFPQCVSEFGVPCTLGHAGSENYYPYVPQAFALIEPADAVDGLTVTCSVSFPPVTTLGDDVPSEPVSIAARTEALFLYEAPRDGTVTCKTTAVGNPGEIDLMLQLETLPSRSSSWRSNCTAETEASSESCSVQVATGTKNSRAVYVMLAPYSGGVEDAVVVCTTTSNTLPTSLIETIIGILVGLLDSMALSGSFFGFGR